MAHRKAGGSSRNGRELGRPALGGEEVGGQHVIAATSSFAACHHPGNPGDGVGMGKDTQRCSRCARATSNSRPSREGPRLRFVKPH